MSRIFFVRVVSDLEVDSRPLPRVVICLAVSSLLHVGLLIFELRRLRGNSGPRALVSSFVAGGGLGERKLAKWS